MKQLWSLPPVANCINYVYYFQGQHTEHSFNSLLHKQLIQKVTTAKSFVRPGTLPPTKSALG